MGKQKLKTYIKETYKKRVKTKQKQISIKSSMLNTVESRWGSFGIFIEKTANVGQ